LYGKKNKITWPLFHFFIKEEEEDFRNNIYQLEKNLIIKNNTLLVDKFNTKNNDDYNKSEKLLIYLIENG
jgi:hypothetical protein